MSSYAIPVYKIFSAENRLEALDKMFSYISITANHYPHISSYRKMLSIMATSHTENPVDDANELIFLLDNSGALLDYVIYDIKRSKNEETDDTTNYSVIEDADINIYDNYLKYIHKLYLTCSSNSFKGLRSLINLNEQTFQATIVDTNRYLRYYLKAFETSDDIDFFKNLRDKIESNNVNDFDDLIPKSQRDQYFADAMPSITYGYLAEFILLNGITTDIALIKYKNKDKIFVLLQQPFPSETRFIADKQAVDYDTTLSLSPMTNLLLFDYKDTLRILSFFQIMRWG